ncbi:ribonuclease P protein component [Patescibacteria group bacterium]
MLSQKHRLLKKKDFDRVFKKGKGVKQNFLFMKWAKNDLPVSRFGFIVGKKTSKKAPLRNKIKRRMREIIRANLSRIEKGIDIVFISRAGLTKNSFSQLEENIKTAFKKSKIFQ